MLRRIESFLSTGNLQVHDDYRIKTQSGGIISLVSMIIMAGRRDMSEYVGIFHKHTVLVGMLDWHQSLHHERFWSHVCKSASFEFKLSMYILFEFGQELQAAKVQECGCSPSQN